MSLKLTNLNIRFSTYPKPEHYEGRIEYTDAAGGSKVELYLTEKQIDGLFPVCADALINMSQQAADVLRSAIVQKKEEAVEGESKEVNVVTR